MLATLNVPDNWLLLTCDRISFMLKKAADLAAFFCMAFSDITGQTIPESDQYKAVIFDQIYFLL